MLGRTLRAALTARSSRVPTAADLVALLDRFPEPSDTTRVVASPHQRPADHARLLDAVAPEIATRVGAIVERLGTVLGIGDLSDEHVPYSTRVLVCASTAAAAISGPKTAELDLDDV